MKPEGLNQYWYKKWLLEGDTVLQTLEEREKKQVEDVKAIKITALKFKTNKRTCTYNKKTGKAIKKRQIKCIYKAKTQRKPQPKIERNKYHFLEYKDLIRTNTTQENFIDNNKVIDFIDGDTNKIWELYGKYKNSWAFYLKSAGLDTKSTEMELTDLVMECFIDAVLPFILKGKYKGFCFSTFVFNVTKYWILQYYSKNGYTVEYTKKNLYNGYNNAKKFTSKYL